jgi:hypothetical protein
MFSQHIKHAKTNLVKQKQQRERKGARDVLTGGVENGLDHGADPVAGGHALGVCQGQLLDGIKAHPSEIVTRVVRDGNERLYEGAGAALRVERDDVTDELEGLHALPHELGLDLERPRDEDVEVERAHFGDHGLVCCEVAECAQRLRPDSLLSVHHQEAHTLQVRPDEVGGGHRERAHRLYDLDQLKQSLILEVVIVVAVCVCVCVCGLGHNGE